MASQFIGTSVIVSLKSKPDLHFSGLVADVVGQQLILSDVSFPQTERLLPRFVIEGSQIQDLEVAPSGPASSASKALHGPSSASHSTHAQTAPPRNDKSAGPIFVDPAILSVGKKPPEPQTLRRPPAPRESPRLKATDVLHTATGSKAIDTTLSKNHLVVGININGSRNGHIAGPEDAVTSTAANSSILASEVLGKYVEQSPKKDEYTGKRSRRGGKGKISKEAGGLKPGSAEAAKSSSLPVEGFRNGTVSTRTKVPTQSAASEDPDTPEKRSTLKVSHLRKDESSKRRVTRARALLEEEQDGWATEEAMEIQGMGDFDFQGNLSKFDKQTVFNQIKAEDTTADEARLHSHNRLPRLGTAGGKNLHHSENVLVPQNASRVWNSEAGESDDDGMNIDEFGSGRSSRKTMSRQSSKKKIPSRTGSGMIGTATITTTAHLANAFPARQAPLSRTSSPVIGVSTSSDPSFRIGSTSRICPVVSPLQMHDIERIAEVELGLSEDMMTENAARGIAEIALMAINPGGRRLQKGNHNSLPVAVVLAGNNKSGIRAVAAGRHLRNHGVRVLVCILGSASETDLSESFQRQLNIFRNCGGKVGRGEELVTDLKTFDAPAELILDGLLGTSFSFEDLRSADQAVAYELIGWANASKASILAVDMPTGIDASTGVLSVLDGAALHIEPRFVVAMGAPKNGVLNFMAAGGGSAWQLFVADIGISNTAWRKYGTRRKHGVEFGSHWVSSLRFKAERD